MRKVLSYAALCSKLCPSSSIISVIVRESFSSTRDKIDFSLFMSKEVRASKIAFYLLFNVYFALNIRGESRSPPYLSKPLESK